LHAARVAWQADDVVSAASPWQRARRLIAYELTCMSPVCVQRPFGLLLCARWVPLMTTGTMMMRACWFVKAKRLATVGVVSFTLTCYQDLLSDVLHTYVKRPVEKLATIGTTRSFGKSHTYMHVAMNVLARRARRPFETACRFAYHTSIKSN
jgi:hypothetical protein